MLNMNNKSIKKTTNCSCAFIEDDYITIDLTSSHCLVNISSVYPQTICWEKGGSIILDLMVRKTDISRAHIVWRSRVVTWVTAVNTCYLMTCTLPICKLLQSSLLSIWRLSGVIDPIRWRGMQKKFFSLVMQVIFVIYNFSLK